MELSPELMDEVAQKTFDIIEPFVKKHPNHCLWHITYHDPGRFELDVLASCMHRRNESVDHFVRRLVCTAVFAAIDEDLDWDQSNWGLRSTPMPESRWNLN